MHYIISEWQSDNLLETPSREGDSNAMRKKNEREREKKRKKIKVYTQKPYL